MARPIFITRALLATGLLVAALAACGGDGGDSGTENVSGNVSFLVFGEPEELKAFRGVVDAFRQSSRM